MQTASNYAGKAINITKTTAPHAMSYVLTTRYGLPHGHAVGLCLPGVWRMMQERVSEKCIDPRGSSYLNKAFIEISNCLGFESVDEAADWYEVAMDRIGLFRHLYTEEPDVDGLVRSVNLERLRNNPVDLDSEDIRTLYCELFGKKQ